MPWAADHYPAAMQGLPLDVRQKAIDIANALLDEGYDEGRAIRIAIAAAKRWARGRLDRVLWPRAATIGDRRAAQDGITL